jgi:hypothetical protein
MSWAGNTAADGVAPQAARALRLTSGLPPTRCSRAVPDQPLASLKGAAGCWTAAIGQLRTVKVAFGNDCSSASAAIPPCVVPVGNELLAAVQP